MIKFTSWSPSRLADYEQCPQMAKWKHLDKLCTICFKGKLTGGFGKPVVCDTCKKTIMAPPAIARGTAIGESMEQYLIGKQDEPPLAIASDLSRGVALGVRKAVAKNTAKVEFMVTLDKDWRAVDKFHPGAWLRAKMDALVFYPKQRAHVIDWKTGGVDKSTGKPRVDDKYDDQLEIYQVATLAAFPAVLKASSALVFLDAADGPVVDRLPLAKADMWDAAGRWNKRLLPMMNDDIFAPCAGFKCRFCDYSKAKGGPCEIA